MGKIRAPITFTPLGGGVKITNQPGGGESY
jgi:hypothetical protein